MVQMIKFKIVTPGRTVFEREINQATLPVVDGQVTIMPGHRSYIASIKSGEIILKMENEEIVLATSGGFIEFNDNSLVLLADTAEEAKEIDLERAENARKRAEEIKKEKVSMSELEYAKVAAAIEKEAVRVRVARRHHGSHDIRMD